MLNTLKGFVTGLVAGCLFLILLVYNRHIVRTTEGTMLVPRGEGGFHHIYVDVREWGALDFMYAPNRPLTEALARHGYEGAKKSAQEKVDAALEQVEGKMDEAKKKLDGFLGRRPGE